MNPDTTTAQGAEPQLVDLARAEQRLAALTFLEREVVKLRTGLADGYGYSHEQIGRMLKISGEEVMGIEARAMGRLEEQVVAGSGFVVLS